MSYLLEILGRGLLAELSCAFRDLLHDDGHFSTDELRSACARDPDSPEPAIKLGTRCLSNRDYPGARSAFESALATRCGRTNLAARVGLACVDDESGRSGQAVEHLNLARQDHPADATVLFALGFCREKWGKPEQAIADYKACLQVAPNLRNAHERLAAIHLKQNDLDRAIEHYEHICRYEPGEVVSILTLANLYLQAGRSEEAVDRYQFALTIEPDNWEARDDLAAAYEQAGLYGEAIEQLDEMVRTQPAFADNHLRLGDLYVKIGDHHRALGEYMTALELHPDYLEAIIKVGTTNLRGGKYAEAVQWFNKAVEINDRVLTACVGLGVAQQELGHSDEALASFEMAANAEPNSTLLFSETARLQLKMAANHQMKRYLVPARMSRSDLAPSPPPVTDLIDRQIERHRTALAERPNYADLHYRLGLLLKHKGEPADAVESFRAAVAINPQYVKAVIQLGLTLHELGSSQEAADMLKRAVEADPESVELHYQLGLVFADRSQFALALEQYEQALGSGSKDTDLHANIALALQNMGLIDRAEASWHILSELTTQSHPDREMLHPI